MNEDTCSSLFCGQFRLVTGRSDCENSGGTGLSQVGVSLWKSLLTNAFFKKIIYLFSAVLHLGRCAQAFPGCGERGRSWSQCLASHSGGFCCCRAQARGVQASVAVVHRLSAGGVFRTRKQTHTPFLGRRFLNHLTTRDVPPIDLNQCFSHCFRLLWTSFVAPMVKNLHTM